MDFMYIGVKLVTGFFGLWLITRLLGKKEISQLTPFDFVSSLILSELVGNTIYDKEVHYSELLFALALWAGLSLGLEKLVQTFPWLNSKIGGRPDLIVRDGKVDHEALKRNKLDMHQVTMLLREQNVFTLREVAFAVFETNGNLSVMKKSAVDSVTREDLDLADKPVDMPVLLIDNGEVDEDQLKSIGRDKFWLEKELQDQGFLRLEEVIYAEWTQTQGLYAQSGS
ncbi:MULTISPECIES: DUF421 domain-containing protein [Paenibacillus]|uniref:DUF421 domain-containing protein n=1 Tax=Paenibacillus TaxID=44249 RepID=UPI0022B92860|nr:DUF421 domain-containing protein [Paenibacillus caseinilyticus]MCZ8521091.1 DUF421 domain-containing protein [Paenibacillus caseinilyticus]